MVTESDQILRQAVTDSLVTFSEAMLPNYKAAAVHRLLARKLQDCVEGKIKRLTISVPPRMGKSQLASINLPAWALTRRPGMHVIQASYGADLAEGFSKQVKALLTSEGYRSLFPPIVHPDTNRQREWSTLQGGAYFATGVGGGGLGRGADLFIVDDAFKNREEADSAVFRDRAWSWFTSTAMTRLSPDGVLIVIGSRWHEDDLIGRIIAGYPEFESLSLKALCDDPTTDPLRRKEGESIWPARWTVPRLEELKTAMGRREFSSHYQQSPTPPGGAVCDVSKVKFVELAQVPALDRVGRGWDLALGIAKANDYSCGAKGGFDKEGNFILLDMNRSKRAWPEQKAVICALAYLERNKIGIEAVSAWQIAVSEIRKELEGVANVRDIKVSTSKEARAVGWLSLIEAGKFYVVKASWSHEFINELATFPAGKHDDQVDAVSVLWETLRRQRDVFG